MVSDRIITKIEDMNKLLLAALALVILAFSSCEQDDDPTNPGTNENKPIVLDCRYDGDHTLKNHRDGVDYTADCLVEIFSGTLTIESGVTIEFGVNGGLATTSSGYLDIAGISGEEVVIKGSRSQGWQGIWIAHSDGLNTISNAKIENAGQGDGFFLFRKESAAITVAGKLAITDTHISDSNGIGIITNDEQGASTIRTFEDVTISNCSSYPIKVSPFNIKTMDLESCTLKENGENYIVLDTKDKNRLEQSLTLKKVDTPYLLSSYMELYAGLTLEAGVDLVMDNNVELHCVDRDQSFLNIAGTQSKHVTIRGKEALQGYWKGILVTGDNVKNIFEYLDISDAGSAPLGRAEKGANITLGDNGTLVVNNCTGARSLTSCDLSVYSFIAEPTLTNHSPELEVCN